MFPSDRAHLLEDDGSDRWNSTPVLCCNRTDSEIVLADKAPSSRMTTTVPRKRNSTPAGRPPICAGSSTRTGGATAAAIRRVTNAARRIVTRSQPRMEPAGGSTGSISAPVPPHRGFNQKARDVLIGDDAFNLINVNGRGMSNKSASEFDLRRKLNSLSSRKKDSNGSSPKSQTSVSSIPENSTITFDTIGERPSAKRHMKLSDIGKTQSCAELKSDKRLLRTFQEDNIIKMPSMDSDIGSPMRSDIEQLCLSFEGIGKSMIYTQNNDNNSTDVKKKGKK